MRIFIKHLDMVRGKLTTYDRVDYTVYDIDIPVNLELTTIEDREAALKAIHEYDVRHGRIAPAEWDHVHRVTPDEQGTGNA